MAKAKSKAKPRNAKKTVAKKTAAKKSIAVIVDDGIAKRELELRALFEERPTDADAVLVYADWLEEQGDMPRASFLRVQQDLRKMKVSHPKLLDKGRALYDLGKTLPPDWVAAVTHPKLAGTAWDGKDDDGLLIWRFLPTGVINYTQPSGTYENGTWFQHGITVAIETNAHYADYFGVIIGDTIRGNAHNIVEHKWRWKVKLTEDASVAGMPDNVNRTIHDDHVRRSAKPKKRGKKRRPNAMILTRVAPLTRKTKLKAKKPIARGGKSQRR